MPNREACCLVVALSVTLAIGSANAQVVNLALRRPFTASCPTLPGWDGLVDGVRDSDDPPGCWATDNSPKFPKSVTIDLGSVCEITKVVVHNSINGNTKGIQVAVSSDGRGYGLLREYVFPPGKYQPLTHSFAGRAARYVRVTFLDTWGGGLGGDNIIYVREVEVFGKRSQKEPAGLEGAWSQLASARPFAAVPGWPSIKRYLRELGRAVSIAVLCPASLADAIAGPDGWLTEGLRRVGENWLSAKTMVRVLAADTSGEVADRWNAVFGEEPPDLAIIAPGGTVLWEIEPLTRLLTDAHRKGTVVMVCMPLPPAPDADPASYHKLRLQYRTLAAQTEAGVLDVAAISARRVSLADAFKEETAPKVRQAIAAAWADMVR
ncbi:MAG: discoidin domain-containing protein [Armatimonadetes bacterium]|nr:discoidin domain-containing protein [Armatimonadota bacterium]